MTTITDTQFHTTCNNLLYPHRTQPAPRTLTPEQVRAEAEIIARMLQDAADKKLRKAFSKAKRGKITLEQLGEAIDTYFAETE